MKRKAPSVEGQESPGGAQPSNQRPSPSTEPCSHPLARRWLRSRRVYGGAMPGEQPWTRRPLRRSGTEHDSDSSTRRPEPTPSEQRQMSALDLHAKDDVNHE